MRRALILTPIALIVACVGLFISGYGFLETKRDGLCLYFVGLGENLVPASDPRTHCRWFDRAPLQIP